MRIDSLYNPLAFFVLKDKDIQNSCCVALLYEHLPNPNLNGGAMQYV